MLKLSLAAHENIWRRSPRTWHYQLSVAGLKQAVACKSLPSSPSKVSVELDIGEMFSLIEYHYKIAESIPKELYPTMTAAGHTFEVTANKHIRRQRELSGILNETWPK
jgi:hypothetical protein